MKLGVMASGIAALGWDRALDFCQQLGLQAIEIPCGIWSRTQLLPLAQLLDDPAGVRQIKEDLSRHGLEISALSCHGNPVHPDPDEARRHEAAHDNAVRLAAQLGVGVVCNFSGCPGGAPGERTPNWITCPWPAQFARMLEYQWHDVLIPFWERKTAEARNQGVHIAIEPHPGFTVYNPDTLLRLRAASGDHLGVNFDPSHFFWQGIDSVEAARLLGDAGAILHVHAKDTSIHDSNTQRNGVLDTKNYAEVDHRSWVFRTCGMGHGDDFWLAFVSMLRSTGYDGVLSIEHEDSRMSWQQGFEKAASYLQDVVKRTA